jgi:hypothetical protein
MFLFGMATGVGSFTVLEVHMISDAVDLRGLCRYENGGHGLLDKLRRGPLDVESQVSNLMNMGRTIGFLQEDPDWVLADARALADLGYMGRLYWDLPPEVITMDELIAEANKYRVKGSPRANYDSSIWIPDEHENGLTSEQWNGKSRPPAIRLSVFRAKASDPEEESDADPILHGLNLSYTDQLGLTAMVVEEFDKAFPSFRMETVSQKGIASMLLCDRINHMPIHDRILTKGFLRTMFGWWHLYGNPDALRCGSVTLSTDWFIMSESVGHPYPSDGFGLSIGRNMRDCATG